MSFLPDIPNGEARPVFGCMDWYQNGCWIGRAVAVAVVRFSMRQAYSRLAGTFGKILKSKVLVVEMGFERTEPPQSEQPLFPWDQRIVREIHFPVLAI